MKDRREENETGLAADLEKWHRMVDRRTGRRAWIKIGRDLAAAMLNLGGGPALIAVRMREIGHVTRIMLGWQIERVRIEVCMRGIARLLDRVAGAPAAGETSGQFGEDAIQVGLAEGGGPVAPIADVVARPGRERCGGSAAPGTVNGPVIAAGRRPLEQRSAVLREVVKLGATVLLLPVNLLGGLVELPLKVCIKCLEGVVGLLKVGISVLEICFLPFARIQFGLFQLESLLEQHQPLAEDGFEGKLREDPGNDADGPPIHDARSFRNPAAAGAKDAT